MDPGGHGRGDGLPLGLVVPQRLEGLRTHARRLPRLRPRPCRGRCCHPAPVRRRRPRLGQLGEEGLVEEDPQVRRHAIGRREPPHRRQAPLWALLSHYPGQGFRIGPAPVVLPLPPRSALNLLVGGDSWVDDDAFETRGAVREEPGQVSLAPRDVKDPAAAGAAGAVSTAGAIGAASGGTLEVVQRVGLEDEVSERKDTVARGGGGRPLLGNPGHGTCVSPQRVRPFHNPAPSPSAPPRGTTRTHPSWAPWGQSEGGQAQASITPRHLVRTVPQPYPEIQTSCASPSLPRLASWSRPPSRTRK
mmetsp:Transcript_66240/g.209392  ORF Transcript_66240/g.209392 Transcript_66240/m.209392 type:complete len:303 (+) Transcript_66240:785-1693(+)